MHFVFDPVVAPVIFRLKGRFWDYGSAKTFVVVTVCVKLSLSSVLMPISRDLITGGIGRLKNHGKNKDMNPSVRLKLKLRPLEKGLL